MVKTRKNGLKRAFISVWDKTGLESLADFLRDRGFDLVSTGGTAQRLKEHGLAVTLVEELTGQPSLMDGRLKTLDLRVFGPILYDRDKPGHRKDLEKLAQNPINLVVVNLYPFAAMRERGLPPEELVEYIDIGGPSLLRAAAKNYRHVTVLCRPGQYQRFQELYDRHGGDLPEDERRSLAAEVFRRTTEYDRLIGEFLGGAGSDPAPALEVRADLHQRLRYGENPHQSAGFYLPPGVSPPWRQLHGKELSFNNYADLEAAQQIVAQFDQPAAVIVKHANPCGFAVGETSLEAYRRAGSTDPVSSFGGIVAFNSPVEPDTAEALAEIFLECIIAPRFVQGALARLMKKKNLRLLEADPGAGISGREVRSVAGGYLVQDRDRPLGEGNWKIVSRRPPTESEMQAMRLGWKMVRFVKSNAVVFSALNQLLGVGAGQMSRVDAVHLAGMKAAQAELDLQGAAMASDAFFPFPDGVEVAAGLGIKAVIQPGGSVRDEEVIAAADSNDMSMILTGSRHFRH